MAYEFNGILVCEDMGAGQLTDMTFDDVWRHLRNGGIVAFYRTETTTQGIVRHGILFPYVYWAETDIELYPRIIYIGNQAYKESVDGGFEAFTPVG